MKNLIRRLARPTLAFCMVLAALCGFAARAHADDQPLGEVLDQVRRLQALAQEYAAQADGSRDPLLLTINYIRGQRYTDFTWDMILGAADEDFSARVRAEAPELAALQTVQNVALPTGESVDFVHLTAGIGATYRRVPVVCTWGGDCIQLAESVQGNTDEADCIRQLGPYFASADENASLLPRSDWLADLDGVNIGGALPDGADLAGQIEAYYASVTGESRARQFVAAQFGAADTGDTEAFRALVKSTFFQDSGVQLFLMSQEHLTLDSQKDPIPTEGMRAPLNAACSLVADELAAMLGGAQVQAPAPSRPGPTEQPNSGAASPPAASPAPAPGPALPAGLMKMLFLLAGGAAFCGLLLVLFTRRK